MFSHAPLNILSTQTIKAEVETADEINTKQIADFQKSLQEWQIQCFDAKYERCVDAA